MKDGNGLVTRARARTREELLEMALDVYEAAGNAERTYSNARGESVSYAQPDFKAQLGAIRLMAELQGMLKNQPDDGASAAEMVWPRTKTHTEPQRKDRQ